MSDPGTNTGVIIVDHGSRRKESNDLLLAATDQFRNVAPYRIVQPAHMELAQPDIAAAFDACVALGATRIVVFPYFLSPGRHWSQDIPNLVQAAAEPHPHISWSVTPPFGLHDGMLQIMLERISDAV